MISLDLGGFLVYGVFLLEDGDIDIEKLEIRIRDGDGVMCL